MEPPNSKLKQITGSSWVLPDRINTGVVKGPGGTCLLIDSGLDRGAGNKIAAALDAEGLRPVALLVTHTHADHCGGNEALHRKHGMPTYGPPLETAILQYPVMEPMYLYGATPPEALQNKFFLAPPTPDARPLQPGRHVIGGIGITAVPLPGHSPDHYGYLTDDGVLYCGDALFPAYVWEKYRLPFFYDIGTALSTLDTLEAMAPTLSGCVAAHYGAVNLTELVTENRAHLLELVSWVEGLLASAPASREDAVAAAFKQFELTQNEAQYYLIGSTVAALLTHLCKIGKAAAQMEHGRLLYHLK